MRVDQQPRIIALAVALLLLGTLTACTPEPHPALPRPSQVYLTLPSMSVNFQPGSIEPPLPTEVSTVAQFRGQLSDVDRIIQLVEDGVGVHAYELHNTGVLVTALEAAYETSSGSAFTDIAFAPVLLGLVDGEWHSLPVPAETAANRVPARIADALDSVSRTLLASSPPTDGG